MGKCSLCPEKRYLNKETKKCLCNMGLFDENKICKNCSPVCRSCRELGSCLTCIDNINRNTKPKCNCLDGYFLNILNNYNCEPCDNKVCGTCENNSRFCIIPCLPKCYTCKIDGLCKECIKNYYLT